jgi:hypothetical protein
MTSNRTQNLNADIAAYQPLGFLPPSKVQAALYLYAATIRISQQVAIVEAAILNSFLR